MSAAAAAASLPRPGAVASGHALSTNEATAADKVKHLFVLDVGTRVVVEPLSAAAAQASATFEFQLVIGDRWLALSCTAADAPMWTSALEEATRQ